LEWREAREAQPVVVVLAEVQAQRAQPEQQHHCNMLEVLLETQLAVHGHQVIGTPRRQGNLMVPVTQPHLQIHRVK
jgi:hypothetical protein